MANMVYLEVLRKNAHYMFAIHESSVVLEVKKVVGGIIKKKSAEQILKVRFGPNSDWTEMDEERLIADYNITPFTASIDAPLKIALCIPKEDVGVDIYPMSVPAPLPRISDE